MANWDKVGGRGNIEDRRMNPGVVGGGLSLTGLALYLIFSYLSGGNVGDVLTGLQNVQIQEPQSANTTAFDGEDTYEVFASKVLGSANDMWSQVFSGSGIVYEEPRLVLFRGATDSGCGGADARVGPHYCPADQTIYLDETFFEELTRRFGAKGGDVAQAYVIAHEVGHHAQQELYGSTYTESNEDSVRQELQADCFAGLWAYSLSDDGVFEEGEIAEAMDAAAAVGDDRIQATINGRVNPESWTHGSSEARVAAFNTGYTTGNVEACST